MDETIPKSPPGSGLLNQIVVAVNFLPASLAAADYAFAIAEATHARVTAVHVLPEQWEGPRRFDANVDEARQLVEQHFRQILHIAVSDIGGSGANRDEIVTSGRPCVELARIATAGDANLIVMGIDAGQRSGEALGETTSCVMQFARRTVLLVPDRLFRAPAVGRSQ